MRTPALTLMLLLLLVPLSGCIDNLVPTTGDDVVEPGPEPDDGTPVLEDPWSSYLVPTASDLPDCPGTDDVNLGRLYYVDDVQDFHACASDGWTVVDFAQEVNQPPRISATVYSYYEEFDFLDPDCLSGDFEGPACDWNFMFSMRWSAVDPEGEAVTIGVDHDRDGVVDIALPKAEGNVLDGDDPVTYGRVPVPWNGSMVVDRMVGGEGCAFVVSRFVDIVATDASGATSTHTLVMGGINAQASYNTIYPEWDSDFELLYTGWLSQDDIDWYTGTATDSPCTSDGGDDGGDGDLTLYVFTAEDAGGTVSANTDDALVRVAMTQGSGINWASLDVKITVGEGTPMTCDRSEAGDGSDVETDCYMAEYGTTNDAEWTIGDGVTIYENGQDLCSAGESCAVEVVIVNSREGQTLDESNTVAE
ncbi:MAG: hypothetical protein O3B05_07160 [archaeon]|nr:hypothetical protein [archaeon]